MKNILLIGATGSLGRIIAERLVTMDNIRLSVLVRQPQRLPENLNAYVFHGAVEQADILAIAMHGQDAVIAELLLFAYKARRRRQYK